MAEHHAVYRKILRDTVTGASFGALAPGHIKLAGVAIGAAGGLTYSLAELGIRKARGERLVDPQDDPDRLRAEMATLAGVGTILGALTSGNKKAAIALGAAGGALAGYGSPFIGRAAEIMTQSFESSARPPGRMPLGGPKPEHHGSYLERMKAKAAGAVDVAGSSAKSLLRSASEVLDRSVVAAGGAVNATRSAVNSRALSDTELVDRGVRYARDLGNRIEAEVKRRAILTMVPDNGNVTNTIVRKAAQVAPVTTFDVARAAFDRLYPTIDAKADAVFGQKAGIGELIRDVRAASQRVKGTFERASNPIIKNVEASVDRIRNGNREMRRDAARPSLSDGPMMLGGPRDRIAADQAATRRVDDAVRRGVTPGNADLEASFRDREREGTAVARTDDQTRRLRRLSRFTTHPANTSVTNYWNARYDLNRRQAGLDTGGVRGVEVNASRSSWRRGDMPTAGSVNVRVADPLSRYGTMRANRTELNAAQAAFDNVAGHQPDRERVIRRLFDAQAAISAQTRKVEQKEALEDKNVARVRGQTDAKRDAGERFREITNNARTANDEADAEEAAMQPLLKEWQRRSPSGKMITVRRRKFWR